MAKLPVAILAAVLMIVLVSAHGDKKSHQKRAAFQITSNADVFQWICQISGNGYTFCTASGTTTKATPLTTSTRPMPSTTTRPTTPGKQTTAAPSTAEDVSTAVTTTEEQTTTTTTATTSKSTTSSSTPSALQLAHWCQYAYNGSWLPYNYTFMHLPCLMCRCQEDHQITCNELQCMNLHCIDGSKPLNITGQCCPQCTYEQAPTLCRMNGLTFPHGAFVTKLEPDVECWCQSGSIECRKVATMPTTTQTTPAMVTANNNLHFIMTPYIIVIVICLILMLGTLLCCGCALAYYYYYQNQQQNIQQAYEQYYNNAGWQPMGADGQVDGTIAEEKQAEAAQQAAGDYPTGQLPQYIPPPYAVYSGPYEHKAHEAKQV